MRIEFSKRIGVTCLLAAYALGTANLRGQECTDPCIPEDECSVPPCPGGYVDNGAGCLRSPLHRRAWHGTASWRWPSLTCRFMVETEMESLTSTTPCSPNCGFGRI